MNTYYTPYTILFINPEHLRDTKIVFVKQEELLKSEGINSPRFAKLITISASSSKRLSCVVPLGGACVVYSGAL